MNFEILNGILQEVMDEEPFYEEDYYLIKKYCEIIRSAELPCYNTRYRFNMGINTSLMYSLDFLEKINPRYSDNLERLISNNQLYLHDGKNNYGLSQLIIKDNKSIIDMYQRGTIEDSYTLTHENIHDTNRDINNITVTWHLMTETFSILSEMLQMEYFKKLSITPKNYKLNEIDTLIALYIKACRLDFEIELLFAYNNYGYINRYIYNEILSKYNNLYEKSEASNHLLDIIEKKDLDYTLLQRDIVGGILSSYMFERIENDSSRIKEFIELNDNINNISFVEVLNYLDLDIIDKEFVLLSNTSNNILNDSYKKRLKRVYR